MPKQYGMVDTISNVQCAQWGSWDWRGRLCCWLLGVGCSSSTVTCQIRLMIAFLNDNFVKENSRISASKGNDSSNEQCSPFIFRNNITATKR